MSSFISKWNCNIHVLCYPCAVVLVMQELFKKFAKRVSEHLMVNAGDLQRSSIEAEAETLLVDYFKRFGKFSSENDFKKLDNILMVRFK